MTWRSADAWNNIMGIESGVQSCVLLVIGASLLRDGGTSSEANRKIADHVRGNLELDSKESGLAKRWKTDQSLQPDLPELMGGNHAEREGCTERLGPTAQESMESELILANT
jgi:hypothetical protein